MSKILFNWSLNDLPHRYGYKLPFIFLFALLLNACQSQSVPQPAQTVEVVTQTDLPATPSATPTCTPLLPGMSVSIHPLLNQEMLIQLKSFRPGEKVDLSGNTAYDGNGQGFEIYDLLIGPDGSASDRQGSLAATGAAENHWYIRVTYAGGVACADAHMP
jgi:hypothetical protein